MANALQDDPPSPLTQSWATPLSWSEPGMRNKRPVLQASFCLVINIDAGGPGGQQYDKSSAYLHGRFFRKQRNRNVDIR